MVQAAASLMFFLSLPAGGLADIVERRAFGAVSALSYFTLAGHTSPGILLGLTFAVGLGVALEGPAFQAVVRISGYRPALPATGANKLDAIAF